MLSFKMQGPLYFNTQQSVINLKMLYVYFTGIFTYMSFHKLQDSFIVVIGTNCPKKVLSRDRHDTQML